MKVLGLVLGLVLSLAVVNDVRRRRAGKPLWTANKPARATLDRLGHGASWAWLALLAALGFGGLLAGLLHTLRHL